MTAASWLHCCVMMLCCSFYAYRGTSFLMRRNFCNHAIARTELRFNFHLKQQTSLLSSSSSSLSSSLSSLSSSLSSSSPTLLELSKSQPRIKATQFVFVGGKGGVGKTTTSSAVALACSDNGLRTLVVSTDPAHSLGDSLDVNLTAGTVVPIVTESCLWALEIDVDAALEEFKNTMSEFDTDAISKSLGIPKAMIDSLGLDDIADIFLNPPPGIDEIVALTKIFQYSNERTSSGELRFDRIVIDTAPTGHTLRLLQLPDFLNSLTGRLIKFRAKINGAIDSFRSMFGKGSDQTTGPDKLQAMLGKLDALQENVLLVKNTLKDASRTQFVAVTIPTQLAVAETRRLIGSLQSEGIRVSTLICNQVIDTSPNDFQYIRTRTAGQRKCILKLRDGIRQIEGSSAMPGPDDPVPVQVTEVPFVDTEVTGLYGLRFFHSIAHPPLPRSASNPMDSRKLTIFGGKGGVGKTTSAASWALRLSDSGFRTLVVSSDPAHSLGDALQVKLSGTPVLLERSPLDDGQLWAMEVDPAQALEELSDLLRGTEGGDEGSNSMGGGFMSSMGLPNLSEELRELLLGTKEPPPGTDEIVALAQVINYLDKGFTLPDGSIVRFDRVVLDTAPTGHTLRMLQLPIFLQKLIQKVKRIQGSTGSGRGGGGSRLSDFERKMSRLEAILHSPKECEFTAVTIPTELASSETLRLLGALNMEGILVRRLIVNQVLPSSSDTSGEGGASGVSSYLERVRVGQARSMKELRSLSSAAGINLVQVPYFDMEIRTVYGVRVISKIIFANAP